MTCHEKHTQYQPPIDEFRCPTCNAEAGVFIVDQGPNSNCDLLHLEDVLECVRCSEKNPRRERDYISGKSFAAMLQKKAGLVECDCCKGTGLVKGTK